MVHYGHCSHTTYTHTHTLSLSFSVRILFPFLDGNDRDITAIGLTRLGDADPDDYLCINSGNIIIIIIVSSLNTGDDTGNTLIVTRVK